MIDEVPAVRPSLVCITIDGQTGWTFWFDGDPDVLLARDGRVMLFSTLDALSAATTNASMSFAPTAHAPLDGASLRSVLASEPAVIDFDAIAAWFSNPGREVTVEACDRALNALNMAIDVGSTVGDRRRC